LQVMLKDMPALYKNCTRVVINVFGFDYNLLLDHLLITTSQAQAVEYDFRLSILILVSFVTKPKHTYTYISIITSTQNT